MPVKGRAIERYLALARQSGVRPVVVLNKADLADDVAGAVAEATVIAGDAPVHAVSARAAGGTAALEQYFVAGQTLALLGPSGAGKSSLVNRLIGEDVLATGEVREWDARGRHTSVHRQLLLRPGGGLIVDTPGMRELRLWEGDEGLGDTFEEIEHLAPSCRFRDCEHDQEPGCAVKDAVREGRIPEERYAGYLKLRKEQAAIEKLRDERAQLDLKRRAKMGSKALKAMQKTRGR
jgi:ribosome biogenesis GTPase